MSEQNYIQADGWHVGICPDCDGTHLALCIGNEERGQIVLCDHDARRLITQLEDALLKKPRFCSAAQ